MCRFQENAPDQVSLENEEDKISEACGGTNTKHSEDDDHLLQDLEQPVEEERQEKEEEEEEEVEERGSGVGTDEDSLPELFQPSSPLQISKNFILPDIMEESETDQSESLRSSILSSDGIINRSPVKPDISPKFDPFDETGLDVVETNFDDDDVPLPNFGSDNDDEEYHNVSGSSQEPPILPVSPPPGPLLSPRFSMMTLQNEPIGDPNRFSVASVSSEMAPPLPTSLPPGSLIPRESMYQESGAQIDLWYHLMRSTNREPREGFQSDVNKNDSSLEKEMDEVVTSEGFVNGPSLHLTHHLTSDSGFPETDMATTHSDHSTGRTAENAVGICNNFFATSNKNNGSTSATSYSDERTTECSGSVGLKTNASVDSQVWHSNFVFRL